MATFGVYEKSGELFEQKGVFSTNRTAQETATSYQIERMERGEAPVDQRVVPAPDETYLPKKADGEMLSKIVREFRHFF